MRYILNKLNDQGRVQKSVSDDPRILNIEFITDNGNISIHEDPDDNSIIINTQSGAMKIVPQSSNQVRIFTDK